MGVLQSTMIGNFNNTGKLTSMVIDNTYNKNIKSKKNSYDYKKVSVSDNFINERSNMLSNNVYRDEITNNK